MNLRQKQALEDEFEAIVDHELRRMVDAEDGVCAYGSRPEAIERAALIRPDLAKLFVAIERPQVMY